jgi:hypothetical protein
LVRVNARAGETGIFVKKGLSEARAMRERI